MKLAAITTVYRKYSHTQHIIDRFLEGYGWNGTHHHPPMDLVSLYVDQVPKDDLSRDRAASLPQHENLSDHRRSPHLRHSQTRRRRRGHRGRARRLPEDSAKARSHIPRYQFLKSGGRVPLQRAQSFPCSTTSISPGTGSGRSENVRHAPTSQMGFPYHGRIQPARSPGESRPVEFPRRAQSKKPSASATEAWTATISTVWKRSSAWWSGAAAENPA